MEAVFLKLLNMSITAGWIVLAVVLLRLLLKKAPKWISCLLWVLVGLRLILPFSFESKVSVVPSTETIPQEIIYAQEPKPITDVIAADIAMSPVSADILFPAPENSVDPIQVVIFIGTIIWCIGIAGMLIYSLVSYLRVRHKVRASIKLRENIYICDDINTPFILGLIKPKIYLPSALGEKESEYVIAHEKSHLKRCDHLWKPLGFALLTVYWFNPLLWLGYVLLCRDIELACDERVIKDMSADEKKAYSTALLDCSIPRRMISACPLAFGEVNVKNRIKNVLNYKKPAFWIIVVAIIACIVAAICLLTDPKKEDDKADSVHEISLSDIADMNIGTDLPRMIYCDDERVIMNGTFGLLVYNHNEAEIERRVSYDVLKEYGFTGIDAVASPDGKTVYICQHDGMSLNYTYQYDVEKDEISPCNEKPQSFFTKDSGNIVTDEYLLNEAYSGYFNNEFINNYLGVHCTESGFYYLRADRDWCMSSLQLVHHSYALDNDTVYYIFDEIYFSIGSAYTYTVKENGSDCAGVHITLDQWNINNNTLNKFVTVTLHNDGDTLVTTGNIFNLYCYEDGQWIDCSKVSDREWGDVGYAIEPDETFSHTYSMNDFDLSNSGIYRFELIIHSGGKDYKAWVDFEMLWNKSPTEGVSISVKEQKLFSGLPYIEIEWKNETEECMIFSGNFTLSYKEGDEWKDSSTKEINYGATLYALPPHDTVVKKYYLSYNHLREKEYRFSAEYFPDERPSEIHTASICFELGGIVDPMVTNDYQASSVVYASSLLNSPDDLGVGTKYRAVTHYGGIALYQLNSVNEYDYLGIIYYTELTEENFDYLFSEGFKKSGLSAEKLRRENHQFYIASDEENRLRILLFQNDGSAYLVTGHIDEKNKGNSYAERVYELTTPATVSYEFGASGESENKAIFYFRDSVDFMEPKIVLSPESGGFEFVYSGLSSYIAWGSYILTEDTLMLPTSDGMYIYVFDVTDEGFRFDAERSSKIPEYRYSADSYDTECPVPDDALFEGNIAKASSIPRPPITLTETKIPNTPDWKTAGLESIGLAGAEISHTMDYSANSTLHFLTVHTMSDALTDLFIAMERKDDVLLYPISEMCSLMSCETADVDGDKSYEIIMLVDNGGFCSHTAYVLKIEDDRITPLFEKNLYIHPFEEGFSYTLRAPFELLVTNSITGYSTVIDFSDREEYIGEVFDEKGNPLGKWEAKHDCFRTFTPEDVDNDGVYEVIGSMHTHLYSHADGIGDSECTLRYNKDSGEFEVIDARFVKYTDSKIIASGDYYTVTDMGNFTYDYDIVNRSGTILLSDYGLTKEPKIKMISDSVVRRDISGGTGKLCVNTVYCDVRTDKVSEDFTGVWGEYGNKVLYESYEDGVHNIIIQDIFDKDVYYRKIPITKEYIATEVITDVDISEDGIATILYYSDNDYNQSVIRIDLTAAEDDLACFVVPIDFDMEGHVYIWESGKCFTSLYSHSSGYDYVIQDINGNIVLEDHNMKRWPNFHMVNDSVLCMYIQYGTGMLTRQTVYVNIKTGEISPTYGADNGIHGAAYDEYGNNVIYLSLKNDCHYMVVRDIFDEKKYYKEVLLTDDKDAPIENICSWDISSDGIATVTFVADGAYNEKTIEIDMTQK